LVLLGLIPTATADHITGGEIYYVLQGISGNTYRSNITVKLFMRCGSGRPFNSATIISIFNRSTGGRHSDLSVPISRTETINMTHTDPCITNPPVVCYEVGYYQFEVSLPGSPQGYTVTAHVMYRIDGIENLQTGYN